MGERKRQNFQSHPIDTNCRKKLTCDDPNAYVYIKFPTTCTYFYSSEQTFTCKNNTWMAPNLNYELTIVEEIGCAAKECMFSNYQSTLIERFLQRVAFYLKFSRCVKYRVTGKSMNPSMHFGNMDVLHIFTCRIWIKLSTYIEAGIS